MAVYGLRSAVQEKVLVSERVHMLTLAVDSHSTVSALADMQEAARDDITGCAAVHKEQVVMVEAGVCEALGIINLLIEADDGGDIVFAKVGEISLGGVERVPWNTQRRKMTNSSSGEVYKYHLNSLSSEFTCCKSFLRTFSGRRMLLLQFA